MNEMLSSGIELMLLGMGIVYGFLAMFVLAISAMSAVVQRYFPDLSAQQISARQIEDAGVLAAITAAVHQYRKKYPKN